MKIATDSDIKQLVIEALDYNANIIAICTCHFGHINSKEDAKKFRNDLLRASEESEKRRKLILGIDE